MKYHWKPKLSVQSLDCHEATALAGTDPDYLTRDLWDTIANGGEAEYELKVQLMDIADELKQDFDPLDATKTWPEDTFPLMPVGKMVLNLNPENYFTETEQAAFSPGAVVPGIEPSADKLLQGRVFSYADTQRHRLGPNYLQLAINSPHVPVENDQRDGAMQSGSFHGAVNYEPNTLAGGTPNEAPAGPTSRDRIEGDVTRRKISLKNDFAQAGDRYRSLSTIDQDHLVDNVVDSLEKADKPKQERMVDHFTTADSERGARVAQGLHL